MNLKREVRSRLGTQCLIGIVALFVAAVIGFGTDILDILDPNTLIVAKFAMIGCAMIYFMSVLCMSILLFGDMIETLRQSVRDDDQ